MLGSGRVEEELFPDLPEALFDGVHAGLNADLSGLQGGIARICRFLRRKISFE
jgi:hypothetical protein